MCSLRLRSSIPLHDKIKHQNVRFAGTKKEEAAYLAKYAPQNHRIGTIYCHFCSKNIEYDITNVCADMFQTLPASAASGSGKFTEVRENETFQIMDWPFIAVQLFTGAVAGGNGLHDGV